MIDTQTTIPRRPVPRPGPRWGKDNNEKRLHYNHVVALIELMEDQEDPLSEIETAALARLRQIKADQESYMRWKRGRDREASRAGMDGVEGHI